MKGRCGNLGDKSLVEFFGGSRKGLGLTHKTSTSTDEATEQKAKGTSSSSETSWEGWLDRIGLIFGGGEHLIHFDLEIFTTTTK